MNREIAGTNPGPNINEMSGQEKIEHIRGKIPDYAIKLNDTLSLALPNISSYDEKNQTRIKEAFSLRVELYLASPSGETIGGDRLAHLPQLGVSLVDQETYNTMAASAAAFAASCMDQAGFRERANLTYTDLGRRIASNYLPKKK